jgi:hypothetical protein
MYEQTQQLGREAATLMSIEKESEEAEGGASPAEPTTG